MNAIFVIAQNTFKETVRNRVMVNILAFAIGMVLIALVISNWSIDQQAKILKDFGLAAISIFGLLIALFVGGRTIYQEIEKHTAYMLVSKPISRWQIILGKYFGLGLTILINIVAISICLFVVDYFVEQRVDFGLLPGIYLIIFEIYLIIAFAIFFSTFTSPLLSAIFTLVIYVIGHLAPSIKLYTQLHPEEAGNNILLAINTIIPNLENFNIKTAVVENLSLPPNTILNATIYGMAYIVILMILTSWIFSKKDLK